MPGWTGRRGTGLLDVDLPTIRHDGCGGNKRMRRRFPPATLPATFEAEAGPADVAVVWFCTRYSGRKVSDELLQNIRPERLFDSRHGQPVREPVTPAVLPVVPAAQNVSPE